MPVTKYRSVGEISFRRPSRPLCSANLIELFDVIEVAFQLRPWSFPAGVRKFRSIEDAYRYKRERDLQALSRRA